MDIDLRMIAKYGLSLDSRTRYHLVYDCHTWTVLGVYTDLAEAVRRLEPALPADYDYRTYRAKGLAKDIDVWELLRELSYTVSTELRSRRHAGKSATDIDLVRMRTRTCADFSAVAASGGDRV